MGRSPDNDRIEKDTADRASHPKRLDGDQRGHVGIAEPSLIGVVLIVLGLGCFPVGYGINPVRDLSRFENLVDLGLFWKVGVMLVGIGIAFAFLFVGGIVFVFTSSSSPGAPK